MSAHAVLGASSAGRWMRCLGSPRLIAALPEAERSRSSRYAAEGTAAHSLAERCLRSGAAPGDFLGRQLRVPDWPETFPVTVEMAEAVQLYLDALTEERRRLPVSELLIEQRVYPLAGMEAEMFGTADAILWDPVASELVVSDLKYGAGVVVEAEANAQLKYYGLGALRLVAGEDGAEAVEKVRVTIAQPRADHADGPIRSEDLSARDLVEWGGTLRSAALATREPDAPLVPGDWCKFCPAAATCPALRALVVERTQLDFQDLDLSDPKERLQLMLPDPTDPEQLGAAVAFVPLLDLWCREVKGMALRSAMRGVAIPGQKLVRSKGTKRRWADEEAVVAELKERGLPEEDLFEKKLRSPAQLERVRAIGKEWVKARAVKPEGELILAPDSDRRKAELPPVSTDFEDLFVTSGEAADTSE